MATEPEALVGAQLIRGLLAALCALVLAGCPGSEPLPPTGRTIVIALEADRPGTATGWRPEHRRALKAQLPRVLGATGDTWVVVDEGALTAPAAFTLRTFDSGPRCPHGGGNYDLEGRAQAWIDYACAHSACDPDEPEDTCPRLVGIATHETLHWYSDHSPAHTVEHICRYSSEEVGCWTGEYGESVMNSVLPPEFDPTGEPLGPTTPELNALTLRWVRGLTR